MKNMRAYLRAPLRAQKAARFAGLATALLVLAIVATTTIAYSDVPGRTFRVSVSSTEEQAGAQSLNPAVSADGLQIAFLSDASDLVAGDTNDVRDAFVRDTATGNTVRVSVGPGGEQSDAGVDNPAISATGRFVAFDSGASTLGVSGGEDRVYVRDRDTDEDGIFDESGATTTVVVSRNTAGALSNDFSRRPSLSADGRYVAFESMGTNLAANAGGNQADIFLRDRDTDGDGVFDEGGAVTTTLVSRRAFGGSGGGLDDSTDAQISADGGSVAFHSIAANLIGNDEDTDNFCDDNCDTNNDGDIFVAELTSGAISLVSRRSNGNIGGCSNPDPPATFPECNSNPSISADGRHVAFDSVSTNLVVGDSNGDRDVFVRDRDVDGDGTPGPGATFRVSVETDGDQANNESLRPSITAEGRYVAFDSIASDLIRDNPDEEDTNGARDVFVRDVVAGSTDRVSTDTSGDETRPGTTSLRASISASGRFVGFDSDDETLVALDSNETRDVFVRNRLPNIAIDPVPVMFESRTMRTTSPPQTVTVTNEGSGPLDVRAVQLTGGNPDDFLISADSCTSTRLHSEDSCIVDVRFEPLLPDTRTALLLVNFGDPDIPDPSVLLVGSGNTPVLSLNPAVGRPGSVTIVTGIDFPADTKIKFRWKPGNGQAQVIADPLGNLQIDMLAMHNDALGPRLLVANGGGVRVTVPFLVGTGSGQPAQFVDRR